MSPEFAEYLRKKQEEWAALREAEDVGDHPPDLDEEEEALLDKAWERTREQ